MQLAYPQNDTRAETLRYLGAGGWQPDAASQVLLQKAEDALRAAATPRGVWKQLPLTALPLQNAGNDIARHLRGCDAMVLMAVTLGSGADTLMRRLELTDIALAAVVDAMASAVMEELCNALEAEIRTSVQAQGHYLTGRFSPGYGDCPLNLQQPFASTARMAAGMALAGLLAGWLSENTSAGMLVCLVLAGAVVFKRERRLPAWMATGLAGALVGFALLITARGNFNRASGFGDYDSLLTRYAMRFFACLNMLKDYALPLLFSFAILFLLLCFARQDAVKADLLWPLILLAGALGANFAMIGSHDYYPRSTHGVFALLAAACAACLVQLNSKAFRRGLACLSACVGIVCGIHMLEAGYDIASYWMMDHVRTQTLRQEISELDEPAAANIISYGIEPYTKWCGAYGLPDIRENGEDSLALGRARWFGVTSITAAETRTYPFAGHTNETYAAGEAAAENAESMD